MVQFGATVSNTTPIYVAYIVSRFESRVKKLTNEYIVMIFFKTQFSSSIRLYNFVLLDAVFFFIKTSLPKRTSILLVFGIFTLFTKCV